MMVVFRDLSFHIFQLKRSEERLKRDDEHNKALHEKGDNIYFSK